ncbi:MAG: OmpA family protein [Saprospiraceae bacterium]|nr:OmpA family protein [Candidatus Vicinibacter affinis]
MHRKKDTSPAKPKPQVIKPATPNASAPLPSKPDAAFSSINVKELKEGQTIRIDKLFFAADSTNYSKESYPALKELADFMKNNPRIVVEIGGHTNDIPETSYCDRLSTMRAKSIYDYLIGAGIAEKRVQFKGYGKRMPLTTNKTADGRKRNQRVEIKILSING